MIVFLIISAMLALLIAGAVVAWRFDKEGLHMGCTIGSVLSAIVFAVVGILILCVQLEGNYYYQNALYEKQMLEYRLDIKENSVTGDELLYHDIVEFNTELYAIKQWANNPWTSWFNNQKIATIDFVKIDGLEEEHLYE